MKKEPHKIGYTIFKTILGIVFRSLYHPRVYNTEVIPKDGPIIVCGNHIHLLDQCLPISGTKRMLHYMAKKEYFDSKKTAWFFKIAGCIPVDRSTKDESAKAAALEVLKQGYALGIFPEGTRNRTDEVLLPFKMGAVSMARKTGATIVPFAITGKYKLFGKPTATFLKPFKVGPKDDLEQANEKLRNMIKEFLENNR